MQVWLNNDKQYPWVVLVPQQNNLKEIHDLCYEDQHTLLDEITLCSKAIQTVGSYQHLHCFGLGQPLRLKSLTTVVYLPE